MKVGSKQCALIAAVAAASPFLFNAPSAHAQNVSNSTWLPAGGGSWITALNWDSDPGSDPDTVPNYPNGADSSAIMINSGATRTITLDAPITVGSMTITNNGTGLHAISGTTTNNLTFDVTSGNATITVNGTTTTQNRLNTPMVFNDMVVVDVTSPAGVGTAGSFLLGGTIVGSGGFTKTGSGRMTLANTPSTTGQFKDYTGATVIDNGRVRISLDGIPRATSSFTIQNNGQIVPLSTGNFSPGGANAATTVFNISGNGPTAGPDASFKGAILPDANLHVTFDNPINLPGGPGVVHSRGTTAASASITFTNAISGPGTLQLTPDGGDGQFGTYFLKSNASTYTGGTTIWGGTVDATLGNLGATTGALSVNAIAFGGTAQTTLLLNTSSPTTVGSLSGVVNAHPVTINNGGQAFTVNQTNAGTYEGVITGAGGLTLGSLSTNTLTLTGANTYAGDTTLNAGTLAVASEANLGTSTNAIQFGGGNLQTNAAIAFTRNAATSAGTDGINTNGFDSTIGTVTGAGGFTKSGAGKLTANQVKVGGALAVTGGAMEVAANGGAAGTVEATALTITGGALRLNDNDLIVNYSGASPEGQIRQYVKDGRVPAATTGIFSTPGSPDDDVVLAVADNTAWGKSAFNGINIDTDTVVGKYTYFGDANLDGKVTGDDYVSVDANLGTGDSWLEGDFNMNGVTTGDDYVAIDANLGKGTPTPLAYAELKEEMVALHVAMFGEEYLTLLAQAEAEGFGASVVPEPAALSLLGLGAVGLLGRRRRRA